MARPMLWRTAIATMRSCMIGAAVAAAGLLACAAFCRGETLLDDRWVDGSRAESNRPVEAAVWVGRVDDVAVEPGRLTTKLGESSQRIWTYFTKGEPARLAVGETLRVSVSFVPRGALATTTSRSFRLGVYHDPGDPRVERDVNNDGGGPTAPWTDATGYAVQVLVTGGESSYAAPLDLGKRTNLTSRSLAGTSGDYTKQSGGQPVTLELDKEYRVVLEVHKASETQVDLTASIYQGDDELSTTSIRDDGSTLGAAPIADRFDLLFLRISDRATTADQIDFTNFKVERLAAPGSE